MLWDGCHEPGFASPHRVSWPDGKSLMEQPAVTVTVFNMIGDQKMKAAAGGHS